MANVNDISESDAGVLFTDFGETVSYNDESITAVIEWGEDRVSGNVFVSEGQTARVVLWVKSEDVQAPEPLDKVVFGGQTWRVAQVQERYPGMFGLLLTGKETPFG
jgi:hypothetical protein